MIKLIGYSFIGFIIWVVIGFIINKLIVKSEFFLYNSILIGVGFFIGAFVVYGLGKNDGKDDKN